MTSSPKILNQLKLLETLYSQGTVDPEIEKTLDKIINQEREKAIQKQQEIERDIEQFQKQYQMSSSEFYQRFHAGELGDDIDFIEWNAFYEMWLTLQKRLQLLQSLDER